jgi:hypothetical protein
MLANHLGQEMAEVEPARAAFENSIIRYLRKHGPSKQKDVYVQTGRRADFQAVIDSLVECRVITRVTTHRKNSFVLRMAPVRRRHEQKITSEVQP